MSDNERYAFLVDKINALTKHPKSAPKLSLEEVDEFLQTWEGEEYRKDFVTWTEHVQNKLNEGDTDILYK